MSHRKGDVWQWAAPPIWDKLARDQLWQDKLSMVMQQTEDHPRIQREKKTVAAMIRLYCRQQHSGGDELCPDCAALHDYAMERLEKCLFQGGKTTCAKCPIHCYRPAMRQEIREVMRYAGPRMTWRHPLMALWHLIDGRRQEPIWPEKHERLRQKINS